jgi:hypothetical protein
MCYDPAMRGSLGLFFAVALAAFSQTGASRPTASAVALTDGVIRIHAATFHQEGATARLRGVEIETQGVAIRADGADFNRQTHVFSLQGNSRVEVVPPAGGRFADLEPQWINPSH